MHARLRDTTILVVVLLALTAASSGQSLARLHESSTVSVGTLGLPAPANQASLAPSSSLNHTQLSLSPYFHGVTVGSFVPPAEFNPDGIAWDPAQQTLFVTERLQNVVLGISSVTYDVTSAAPVGQEPTGAAYDSGRGEVFVNNYNSDNVSVLSATTGQVVTTVSVGVNPQGVVYDPAVGRCSSRTTGPTT